ncbi:GGDEF domain-containing protein [Pseudanabaena sp. PCC 6802]|uniref:GGDEF domain-containing protein n=1 Tax=Pseudanabaena sp. PCC 6802 TaxID=118173 RepID=UPI000A016753|nr:GGDEF domain-containing protein [Pseudanabaena sp. PCC 6802]
MSNMIKSLARQSKAFWIIAGLIQIALLGIIDYLTGYEISLSLFYLVPLAAIAWFIGSRSGIWAAAVSTLVWLIGDISAGQVYSHPLIYAWNAVMRLGLFVCPILLLSALKKSLLHRQALTRIDQSTGAVNSHAFWEVAQIEIERSSRYKRPLTFAYLELDNLKLGLRRDRDEADAMLRSIVSICKKSLRKTDTVARLGSEGFALLLPETPQEGAEVAISTLQMAIFAEMNQNNWPIALNIGVLNCKSVPQTVDEAIEITDSLIDSAKQGGKNVICYATYIG